MKNIKHITAGAIILSFCLVTFAFADNAAKVVQAVESNAKIIYNGKEAALGARPFIIQGSDYLSLNAIAALFGKNMALDRAKGQIIISDKPDAASDSLKSELDTKNKSMAELQDRIKNLENDAASSKLDIEELQNRINDLYSEYEGVGHRVILSGNEDEIRAKIEIDTSWDKAAWGRLNTSQKKDMIREISDMIRAEYDFAIIKGYIKDISQPRKLVIFHTDYNGEVEIGSYKSYSTIGALEEKLNDDYDDYIHGIHFTYGLKGNENRVEFMVYFRKSKFEEKWSKTSDNILRAFMRKICSDIGGTFKGCQINGYIYDSDSGSELASCEQLPKGDFTFGRVQE